MSTVLESWAEFVTRLRASGWRSLPPAVQESLLESFFDTVAVVYSGSRQPAPRGTAAYAAALATPGESACVLGGPTRAELAALVNATAAHAEDYDDAATALIGGHASAILVPVALAVGEEVRATGDEVLTAAAAGYEVMFAAGACVNPYHYEAGFHPTSTLGAIGACATAGALLGLDASTLARALSLAASFASGIKGNFGSPAKAVHCGWAAHGGIAAARLAGHGCGGNATAFDGRHGFAAVYGNADGSRARRDLGDPWFLAEPGIGMRKAWPCCASTHASIEAAARLGREHTFAVEDVRQVISAVPARRMPHTDRPLADTPNAARFSNQYCVAAALVHGELRPRHFEPAAVENPAVRELMRRIRFVADDSLGARDPGMREGADFCAEVTLQLADGSDHSARVDAPLGTRGRPMSAAQLADKFADCVGPVLGAERARELAEALRDLPSAHDVRGLVRPVDAARDPRPTHREPLQSRDERGVHA